MAYLAAIAPATLPSHRETEIKIATWLRMSRIYTDDARIPRAPKDVPAWWSRLPCQLDSFCKLSWPAAWLCITWVVWKFRAAFTRVFALLHGTSKSGSCFSTLVLRYGHGRSAHILITHMVVWLTSVFVCVLRRRMVYLEWLAKEQAIYDEQGRARPQTSYFGRDGSVSSDRNYLKIVAERRARAREADIVKMAAEAMVRKVAVPYFLSLFFCCWIFG